MGSTAITSVIDLGHLAQRLGLPVAGVQATVELLDGGNTIPFITRYRRDQTGGLDEEGVRRIAEGVARARQLADRKQTILRTIQGQGKLTPELETRINAADSPKQLEDVYLPFKPRKLSLAEIARQRKLAADAAAADLDTRAADFVDSDAQVPAVADVLLGVGHIIAHEFSERADVRQRLRSILYRSAHLKSQRVESEGKALSKDEKHFRDYFDYTEHVQRVPPHRLLAINRGERAKLLKVRIEGPAEEMQSLADDLLVPAGHPHAEFLRGCARDALARLVLPSLEREVRREMTEFCEAHAVHVFARNLRNLLLQSPVPGRRVLALDPGFKSGCKAVVIDECGTPLEHAVLHIVGQKEKREAAARRIVELVSTHGCGVIAIGNGTAGRETETLVAELVAGELQSLDVGYVIVNEAGASVYSTSAYGREELPSHEAAIRGAISIGRRLQDPLSELVKIEPANIGVGLYQHDVKARHLHASLDAVVESCVNYVGVDINTASPALLRYVSGLNQTTARNLYEWRTKNGPFTSRQQFLEVPGFGEAAFVQAVGFLKISGGVNPFDSTWIHPESYLVAEQVLQRLGGSPASLATRQEAEALAERAAAAAAGRHHRAIGASGTRSARGSAQAVLQEGRPQAGGPRGGHGIARRGPQRGRLRCLRRHRHARQRPRAHQPVVEPVRPRPARRGERGADRAGLGARTRQGPPARGPDDDFRGGAGTTATATRVAPPGGTRARTGASGTGTDRSRCCTSPGHGTAPPGPSITPVASQAAATRSAGAGAGTASV
jgi:uncharacterized protein